MKKQCKIGKRKKEDTDNYWRQNKNTKEDVKTELEWRQRKKNTQVRDEKRVQEKEDINTKISK